MTVWLTRKSPAKQVDRVERVGVDLVQIAVPLRFRPVLREHIATPLVDLDLPYRSRTQSALDAEFESADPSAQASDSEFARHQNGLSYPLLAFSTTLAGATARTMATS